MEKSGDLNKLNTFSGNDLNDFNNATSIEADTPHETGEDQNEPTEKMSEESGAMPIETDDTSDTSKQNVASVVEAAEVFVEDELSKAETELNALNDKHLRLVAEFENYKRRVARDREDLRKYANEGIISDLLSIIDHLEMAVKHSQGEANDNVVQGVELTLKEFEKILDKNGVKAISAIGEEFDPNVHHAMAQIASSDAEENSVVEEFRKGYMLNEKVIRPAMVAVAKPPEEAEKAEKERTELEDRTEE